LLPAPYAIAHLKLSTFYESRGYEFKPYERIRVYLTNSLEPHEIRDGGQLTFLPMVSGIVQEARAASDIKQNVPVLVIIGNPPYERTSHNEIEHSNKLLEDFYRIDDNRLPDRNTGPLRDDYLRFVRWSVWKLLEQEGAPGHGVLAFVTNRAYLERKLHRGVRNFLLRRFDEIHVFDLHGDQREWFADRVDEKVFKEVQAGIALAVFVKRPESEAENDHAETSLATVRYRESFGRREEKYDACRAAELDDGGWQTLEPHAPLWLFVPYNVQPEYDFWPSLKELFPVNVVGFQTHRDQLVVSFAEDELNERLAKFADAKVPDLYWEEQGVKSNRDWDLAKAREQLAKEGPRRVMRVIYRGLERRWIAMDERVIDYIRTTVSPHLLERADNLALVFATGSLADGPYVSVARTPAPAAALSWRTFGAAYFAPLWLHNPVGDSWDANVANSVFTCLADHSVETDPESFFHYVYALVSAPSYRHRYADALRYDFARVPITGDPELFEQMRVLGAELTHIHLLEHPQLAQEAPSMDGNDRAAIALPDFDETELTLHLAPTLTAKPIMPEAWRYQQGSYPVLRGFLDARVGRALTSEEFNEFRLLAAAVQMTLDRLPKIDELVPAIALSALTAEELLGRRPI
jgi:predicted helicase